MKTHNFNKQNVTSEQVESIKYKEGIPAFLSKDRNTKSKHLDMRWQNAEEKTKTFRWSGTVSVFDVAAYILRKLGNLSTMKLQKLVYYCQAWSMVWDEKPLFNEHIEAWTNGPVVRELFSYHRGYYEISEIQIGNPDILLENQKETIDAVLKFYGNKSAQWLIELSHSEEPWKEVRKDLSSDEISNKIISLNSMANYYSSL